MSAVPSSQAAKTNPPTTIPRPVVDPSIAPTLEAFPFMEELDLNVIRGARGSESISAAEQVLADHPHLQLAEHSIPGPDGNTIILSVFSPKQPRSTSLPAFYHIHGGGQVTGDRFTWLSYAIKYFQSIEVIIVTVEHRLSPETRAPGPAMDCHAGLVWISENASSLGIDPAQIIVYGLSGGGPLAAVTCLIARDRKLPVIPIKAQLLATPMLDDRCESISDQQFEHGTLWCGTINRKAWDYVVGEDVRGTREVTPYQAPARATDLSGLPPTYIDAGECEVFRDPAVMYAMNMWRCGSTCELHIWPGAYHGFDVMCDSSLPIVKVSYQAKVNWIRRILEVDLKSLPVATV